MTIQSNHKPRTKIIKKIIKKSEYVSQQPQTQTHQPKKRVIRKIIRKKTKQPISNIEITPPPPQINIDNNSITTTPSITINNDFKTTTSCDNSDSEENPEGKKNENEEDLEEVLVVNWHCSAHNKHYLLDKITQEVYDKLSHDLVGIRYINDDELSLVDFF